MNALLATAGASFPDALRKLNPQHLFRSPVLFVVWIGAALTTVLAVLHPSTFSISVAVWLWLTIVFANLAEAVAEGRGKAQADTLRRTRTIAHVTDHYVSTPSQTTYSAPLPGCSYPYQTTVDGLSRRSGPSTAYAVRGTLAYGALAWVTCQAGGSRVGTTSVWDRLTDGTWTTDHYVATPSSTTFSSPLRRC